MINQYRKNIRFLFGMCQNKNRSPITITIINILFIQLLVALKLECSMTCNIFLFAILPDLIYYWIRSFGIFLIQGQQYLLLKKFAK